MPKFKYASAYLRRDARHAPHDTIPQHVSSIRRRLYFGRILDSRQDKIITYPLPIEVGVLSAFKITLLAKQAVHSHSSLTNISTNPPASRAPAIHIECSPIALLITAPAAAPTAKINITK